MATTTVTFDLAPETLAALDEIAANMETDRATVLREAVTFFLEDCRRLEAEYDEIEKDMDAGNFLTQDQMEARFEEMVRGKQAA